jgi:hypothetical protein
MRNVARALTGLNDRDTPDGGERQGSAALRKRVRKLARQKLGEGEALRSLDELLKRARLATERRNNLLHGVWGFEFRTRRSTPR